MCRVFNFRCVCVVILLRDQQKLSVGEFDRSILMRRFTCFSLHFLRYFLIKTLFWESFHSLSGNAPFCRKFPFLQFSFLIFGKFPFLVQESFYFPFLVSFYFSFLVSFHFRQFLLFIFRKFPVSVQESYHFSKQESFYFSYQFLFSGPPS